MITSLLFILIGLLVWQLIDLAIRLSSGDQVGGHSSDEALLDDWRELVERSQQQRREIEALELDLLTGKLDEREHATLNAQAREQMLALERQLDETELHTIGLAVDKELARRLGRPLNGGSVDESLRDLVRRDSRVRVVSLRDEVNSRDDDA